MSIKLYNDVFSHSKDEEVCLGDEKQGSRIKSTIFRPNDEATILRKDGPIIR